MRSLMVQSNSFLSRLRIVLRRVRLSLIKKGKWKKTQNLDNCGQDIE